MGQILLCQQGWLRITMVCPMTHQYFQYFQECQEKSHQGYRVWSFKAKDYKFIFSCWAESAVALEFNFLFFFCFSSRTLNFLKEPSEMISHHRTDRIVMLTKLLTYYRGAGTGGAGSAIAPPIFATLA